MMNPVNITAQPDGRREPRANVAWRGQVMLPNRTQIDVKVRDISNGGVGFVSPEPIPSHTRLVISINVPRPDDPRMAYKVATEFTAAYSVIQGHDYRIGATWSLEPAVRDLMKFWIMRILNN